ncbi:MAG TPA: peroxidase family protein [Nocardioides sp.]|nr:peroxidase family protein [Nocardioides sp.]
MASRVKSFRRPLAAAAVTSIAMSLVGASMAGAVDPSQQSSFGRMFPTLDPFRPSDQSLTNLVQTQRDKGLAQLDNDGVPAGFTYLGQFIDHDLTRNTQPLPAAPFDPTTLKNFRTAAFDLDSVYGKGRTDPSSSHMYNPDGSFKVTEEEDQVNGIDDLVRDEAGRATLLIEPRNDENVIIAQMHLAVQSFHNRLIEEGKSFNEARRLTQWHYQWVVVNDYLPHVVGQDRVDMFLGKPVTRGFYQPGSPDAPMTPTEFSTAIFRYGHSQVRDSYEVNDLSEDAPIKVFDFAPGAEDLRGGQHLNERTHIDWSEFFEIDGAQEFEGNLSRKLDTKVSESLFNLPLGAPGLPSTGTNILGQLTLVRSSRYGIPSGQDVARHMGIPVLANNKLGLSQTAYPDFNGEAPLWFYMLAESQLKEGGARLGDVGGRIIAEVFLDQLAVDPASYLNARRGFTPSVEHEGAFTIGDFLNFAGVVEEEEEEATP